jgi:hypothetical protein
MLPKTQNQSCFFTHTRLLAVCAIILFGMIVRTAAALPLQPAEAFFTNVADRLLQQQLGVRLTEIQIAPSNEYSAAVDRLFQVTANIYDATSTNLYPTVFRPLFETRSNGVFLAGFTDDSRVSTLGEWLVSNPYDVPLVIAARKGFPNFNEFTTWTEFLVSRRLQLTRLATNLPPNGTNVMYTLSISNHCATELWNSYTVAYPRAVSITISNFATATMTNELGSILETSALSFVTTNLAAGAWKGRDDKFSFIIPRVITNVFLTNSAYHFQNPSNSFEPLGFSNYEALPDFPIPKWSFTLSNRMTCLISEGNNIVDFALLNTNMTVNLSDALLSGSDPLGSFTPFAIRGIWSTNRPSTGGPTDGIWRQIDISAGESFFPLSVPEWNAYSATRVQNPNAMSNAISIFRDFLKLPPLLGNPPPPPNTSLSMLAPFNPAAKLAIVNVWQANDPLVHYPIEDLQFETSTNFYLLTQPATNIAPATLGEINVRYSPWLGRPNSSYPEYSDRALKDAGLYSSDQWNFPSNQTSLAADWLGRVHRGTPWQTIYLQAEAAPMATWIQNGGDPRAHPTNDWRMAALLASLFNSNDVRSLRSVNTTSFDSWAATLDGLTVLSNNLSHPNFGDVPQFDNITVTSNAPQIAVVVDGINRTRAAQRGQYFTDVGAFLSVPELSSASPWLNLSDDPNGNQTRFGLTDEAYEALPSQLLALMRADPVGTATRIGNSVELHFTAFDGYAYRVESSADFATWTTVSEPHYSTNGIFRLTAHATPSPQFFRAALQPGN